MDGGAAGDGGEDPASSSLNGGLGEMPQLLDFCVYDERKKDNSGGIRGSKRDQRDKQDKKGARGGGSPNEDANLPCECDNPQQNPTGILGECMLCKKRKSCVFDSRFESGNLQRAWRTEGREKLMTKRSVAALEAQTGAREPSVAVDQEYSLWSRKDLNTGGNIQWYYFSVTSPPSLEEGASGGSPRTAVKYPFTARFQIINMMKKDALYNYGMKPATLSCHDRDNIGKDWHHAGEDVRYFKNGLTSHTVDTLGNPDRDEATPKKKKVKQIYTLSFTYTFHRPDTVYFAHCYPYTYSDLQHFLHELEHNERIAKIMHRRLLCHTIAGNRCDILTITTRSNDKEEAMKRPAIVISARVHPGETNSSFAMHGLLRYLLSDQPEAISLRNSFVFKVVPMMNPDGVIHGNYRCSLAATDLNRRYANCNMYLHPTVSNMYRMLWNLQDSRGVLLYLDLHGHSKNKNVFVYGCDIVQQPEAWVRNDLAEKSRMDVIGQCVLSHVPQTFRMHQ